MLCAQDEDQPCAHHQKKVYVSYEGQSYELGTFPAQVKTDYFAMCHQQKKSKVPRFNEQLPRHATTATIDLCCLWVNRKGSQDKTVFRTLKENDEKLKWLFLKNRIFSTEEILKIRTWFFHLVADYSFQNERPEDLLPIFKHAGGNAQILWHFTKNVSDLMADYHDIVNHGPYLLLMSQKQNLQYDLQSYGIEASGPRSYLKMQQARAVGGKKRKKKGLKSFDEFQARRSAKSHRVMQYKIQDGIQDYYNSL